VEKGFPKTRSNKNSLAGGVRNWQKRREGFKILAQSVRQGRRLGSEWRGEPVTLEKINTTTPTTAEMEAGPVVGN